MTIACPDQLKALLAPAGSIRPDPKNPRTGHDINAIAASLRELGWHSAIVVDDSGVVSVGHGRLEAAQQLGEAMVPVLRINEDRARAVARNVADNASGAKSAWDPDNLLSAVGESDLLAGMVEDLDLGAMLDEIGDATAPKISAGGYEKPTGEKAKRSTLVSLILHVEDVEVIERAIGLAEVCALDRGAALTAICEEFIGNHKA